MEKINVKAEEWKTSNIQVFWGEIAPCNHLLQIYENDKVFLDTLEGFAGSAFLSGDSLIIIATSQHLQLLNKRLLKQGFDLDQLRASDRYIALEAKDQFSKFMVKNWPDEKLFYDFVDQLIKKAKKDGKKVLVFGELVALLWEKGHCGATVQLEYLWHQLVHNNSFTLYCAYPKSGFTQHISDSIAQICATHHAILDGKPHASTEINYREIVSSKV
jgi:hypothetical protein